MVSPQSGSVKRLPVSVVGLVAWFAVSIIAGAASVSFFMLKSGSPSLILAADQVKTQIFGSALDKRSRELEATIAKLQKQNDESRRLTARVEGRLENLEGIIGQVTEEPKAKSKDDGKSAKLFKPAAFMSEQRQTLKKLNRMEAELRMLPLQAPVKNGIITSKFGPRAAVLGEDAHFHRGIDISFRGTSNTVYAAGAGIVKEVGTMNGYGLYIDVQHSKNVVTRYAHLQMAQVREGQRLRPGQVIALGGATGRATGAHLHYEILVRGRARDPQLFLGLQKKLQMVLQTQESRNG